MLPPSLEHDDNTLTQLNQPSLPSFWVFFGRNY